eukprot:10807-Prorocentrum_minimum.AAC.2
MRKVRPRTQAAPLPLRPRPDDYVCVCMPLCQEMTLCKIRPPKPSRTHSSKSIQRPGSARNLAARIAAAVKVEPKEPEPPLPPFPPGLETFAPKAVKPKTEALKPIGNVELHWQNNPQVTKPAEQFGGDETGGT